MPKLAVYKFLTFYVYSFDLLNEPPHIHVVKEKGARQKACKIWLNGLIVAKKGNFNSKKLQLVLNIVTENQRLLWRAFQQAKKKKSFKTLRLK